ncbi:phosphotransferase family protein [Sandaracinus amylolyticus]|uniref:Putative aminoglycoside phosphotransferase n=1 Tax=Sandaracinus amylolyticus TaxID=927083 RepID=A0A0F6W7L6_9BACT|nr:phosphotransferase family protein [Sandaracinus amylolyticus]AKF09327.1 Putative aminoglycoside phosphotransferase [Sandaracinus amylolyticus]
MSSNDSIDRAESVRKGAELDLERLRSWLEGQGVRGEIEVLQFPRGYSNLTYLLRAGDREIVLRRPPVGVKIASAHDMGREHRILSKLHAVWPKVPRTIAFCEDDSVLGAPFYVMERVEGVILRAKTPPGLELGEPRMRHLSESLVDTLVEIHGVDLAAAGLSDLGKPQGYIERQVRGWAERYEKAKTDDIPEFDEVVKWLAANMPPESGATLIHNDFKYDNVVYAPDLSRIVAVLDWEMATLGDPLMDLGCTLGYWIDATDPPMMQAMRFGPTNLPGNLTRMEIVERYQQKSGREVTNLPFYFTFALMKLAVVGQQLYARYVKGLTQDPRYALLIEGVRGLSRAAVQVIASRRIDTLST